MRLMGRILILVTCVAGTSALSSSPVCAEQPIFVMNVDDAEPAKVRRILEEGTDESGKVDYLLEISSSKGNSDRVHIKVNLNRTRWGELSLSRKVYYDIDLGSIKRSVERFDKKPVFILTIYYGTPRPNCRLLRGDSRKHLQIDLSDSGRARIFRTKIEGCETGYDELAPSRFIEEGIFVKR